MNSAWHLVKNGWQHTAICDANGTVVCRLDLEDWGVTKKAQAGDLEAEQARLARLIAAAPALLEALEALTNACKVSGVFSDEPRAGEVHAAHYREARTAIAAARGESS